MPSSPEKIFPTYSAIIRKLITPGSTENEIKNINKWKWIAHECENNFI